SSVNCATSLRSWFTFHVSRFSVLGSRFFVLFWSTTVADKLRVGVLFGGQSGEHEVSLVSARAVVDGLDREKYDVIPIGITKQGRWLAGAGALAALEAQADQNLLPGGPST